MIPVVKPYLPEKEKFQSYVSNIYESGYLSNNGPYVKLLEERLSEYLGLKNIICVANGSIALQVIYKSLKLNGEVLTTPFSFAATSSTLRWENLDVSYSDINKLSLNVDPLFLENQINKNTSAILATHVFGNPCDIGSLEKIGNDYGIRIIYDAAHAFGVRLDNKSLLKAGSASAISFHATKLFHTIEGGAVITDDDDLAEKIREMINFGMKDGIPHEMVATNGKMNEFQASMGLCVLDEINLIYSKRKAIWDNYMTELQNYFEIQTWHSHSSNNYSYAPIIFDTEEKLISTMDYLQKHEIQTKRYFYPSLSTLNYSSKEYYCPISESISRRILCLPIYPDLEHEVQSFIIQKIICSLNEKSIN